jgi:hypothetical protein
MKKESLRGQNITLKLKSDKFAAMTRQKMLQRYVQSAAELYATASNLLLKEYRCVCMCRVLCVVVYGCCMSSLFLCLSAFLAWCE